MESPFKWSHHIHALSHFIFVCLVAKSCPTLCSPLDCSLPGSSVHGNSPGKNTGVGCHALLQGIFPTQGSNLCLLPASPAWPGRFFTTESPEKPIVTLIWGLFLFGKPLEEVESLIIQTCLKCLMGSDFWGGWVHTALAWASGMTAFSTWLGYEHAELITVRSCHPQAYFGEQQMLPAVRSSATAATPLPNHDVPWGIQDDKDRKLALDIVKMGNEMATHSSIPAWEIWWTKEHGGL